VHGYAGLEDGFHDDEPTHRWTGSLARLPESWLRVFPGAFTLEVHLRASTLPYRLPPAAAEQRGRRSATPGARRAATATPPARRRAGAISGGRRSDRRQDPPGRVVPLERPARRTG
jgi:hypothetical protein